VGSNVEIVEVTAAAAAIDTTTASVQTSFATASLADLPSASGGSGVINLSLLNAGVGSSGAVGLGSGPSVADSVRATTISRWKESITTAAA